jgi:hypothetical protein
VTDPQPLPRREDDTPPPWWAPYKAEFPSWRAWPGVHRLWVRLPGTMRVYNADDPAGLASQIRAATAGTTPPPRPGYEVPESTRVGDLREHR